MASYSTIFDLRYGSQAFRARVTVAVANAAHNLLQDPASTETEKSWAKEALRDAPAMADRFLWGVVANPTIQTQGDASTDNDIQFVVDSLLPTLGAA